MSDQPIQLDLDAISNLSQIGFADKKIIFEQSNDSCASIELSLNRRICKGRHVITLEGRAFKQGEFVNWSLIGEHSPDLEGISTILAACQAYSFSGMFELITHR